MDIARYRDLFVHRGDVFAEQQQDGAYYPVKRPIEDIDIEEHLAGFTSYGVYVIKPEHAVGWDVNTCTGKNEAVLRNTVKYVVFDLDTYDEAALRFLCHEVEELVDAAYVRTNTLRNLREQFRCLLLENSGGKGFHIWLFLSDPLPAAQVRAWTKDVAFNYEHDKTNHGWPPLEIFPKQDEVAEGAYGNLVKLPFGIHAKTGNRSEVVLLQGWAEAVSNVERLDASLVPAYTPPARKEGRSGATAFPCINKVLEEGAPQGCRDKAMFHFAHYARGTGLPEHLALEWCMDLNGSFSPPLSDNEVMTKVASAYSMASAHPSCNAEWLPDFCPGGEKCFGSWNEARPARKERVVEDPTEYTSMTPLQRREWRRKKMVNRT